LQTLDFWNLDWYGDWGQVSGHVGCALSGDLAAAGEGHVLLESRCSAGTRGFFDEATSIWSAGGEQLGQSQQLAWFSDKPMAAS